MPKVRYRTCRSAGVPRARDRWGFCTIRSPLSACRRRVAALMVQFPPRGCPSRRIQGALRPVSTDSRGTATGLDGFKGHRGPRKAGSRPGTCSGAARSKQFRMQFDYLNIQQSPQTLQFQRCEFVLQTNLGGIACDIGGGHPTTSHPAPLAAMSTLPARRLPLTTT